MAQYGIFFTQLGRDKIAAATAAEPLEITHIAVGDGGGGYPPIDDTITSLVNELGRFPVAGVSIPAPTQRQLSATIDTNIGPAVIRERGLIDSEGDLIAIAQAEPIEIPAPGGASVLDLSVSIIATFNNTEHVRAVVNVQSYVRTGRRVIAGEGMDGGGDLTTDVTIKAKFGTEAGTVAEGNDERITGAAAKTYVDDELAKKADKTYVDTELNKKVDAVSGKGLSTNDYTNAEKAKLAALESSHFRGTYPSESSLSNIPNTEAGDYADVDAGVGQDAERWIWDANDNKWVVQASATSITAAQVKQMYENNPDTNPFTDSERQAVADIPNKADTDYVNNQLENKLNTSAKATEAEAIEGENDTQYMTPLKTKQAIQSLSPGGASIGAERAWGAYLLRNWDEIKREDHNSPSFFSVAWSPQQKIFAAVGRHGTPTAISSVDGTSWVARTTLNGDWVSVIWAPGINLFVAVSIGGDHRVMTSSNGTSWISRTAAENNNWQDVAYSPELGLLVAVANTGTNRVMTSTNGTSWTSVNVPFNGSWYGVEWSAELGIFVAVGLSSGASIMTSTNGTDWVEVPNNISMGLDKLAWSGDLGLFVAISYNRYIYTSTDGVNWISRLPAGHMYSRLNNIIYVKELGVFLIIASAGQPVTVPRGMHSFDGINWYDTDIPGSLYRTAGWSPELGRLVALGAEYSVACTI